MHGKSFTRPTMPAHEHQSQAAQPPAVQVDHEYPEGDVADPYERVEGGGGDNQVSSTPPKRQGNVLGGTWLWDEEEELVAPAVLLPWRIVLLLFVSTAVQNFSYRMSSFMQYWMADWSPEEQRQFGQLAFNMIYLGPVFGLVTDVVRVFRERYRPVMIVAALGNAALCFVCVGIPALTTHYGRSLIVMWLMQVLVIFIYVPMNAVVISYGNSMLHSAQESSARIGGLMAQAMVVRTFSTFCSAFVFAFGDPKSNKVDTERWFMLVGAVLSLVFVALLLLPWTVKRSYFVDRREASLKHSAPVRFYLSVIRARRNALSRRRHATNTTFMFVLCFIFIYFMVPDTLYNTQYSFNYLYTSSFSTGLSQASSILGNFGSVLGALAYALWMYFSYEAERKHRRVVKTNPFQIVFAGCCVWAFGCFFHLFGVMGYSNKSFNYKVFLIFQTIITQACMRFSFMPTLSLAAMHAPRGYETTAFELYSVDTTGGGVVSGLVTTDLMSSMGVTNYAGVTNWGKYWQVALICVFFQFLPVLPALSLPKHRDITESQEPLVKEETDDNESPLFGHDPTDEQEEREQLKQPRYGEGDLS